MSGRYAPSPSGPLHLGNLRTALLAWLQARLTNQPLILRMEDLDLPRVKPGSSEQILKDLRWLGLEWDEGPDIGGPSAPYEQSARNPQYQQAFQQLLDNDLVYPCYCSRRDIQQAASAPHTHEHGPIYPGTCRDPTKRAAIKQRHPDKIAAWRYRVPTRTIEFEDCIIGHISQSLDREVGDFVIKRADGLFAYQLAVVVDDGMMGITDVVRGADLLDSTARQIELFETLGYPVPSFWHVPLMLDDTGVRLSKRDGADSLEMWQQQGKSAEMVIGHLAFTVGLIDEERAISTLELVQGLTLDLLRDKLINRL
ncbi:Glutamyl-Q tRNA(Asp) synthetase [hydrothermal vent metagenome]|uniref:Glutamyl-Q tRNA(Asp) synthetase n=1 Tax=hydrothermal vent metagenome TaxID=652676 RepID=A0A3B0ZL81_9ZZZZ